MKRRVLLILLILLIVNCGKKLLYKKESDITFDNLIKVNDVYYEKEKLVPYSGEIFKYHKNRIEFKGKLASGKKEGIWENGRFNFEEGFDLVTYRGGIKEGRAQEFYLDGQVWSEGNYHSNNKVGVWQSYYEDGSKSYETYYYEDGSTIKTQREIAFSKTDEQDKLKNGRYFYALVTGISIYDLHFHDGNLIFGSIYSKNGILQEKIGKEPWN